ncbi:hypothetical protein ANO11243_048350 [Dothideomycetidae sp. 11243]|nr:hypothetical protein ANO11243_048350 [fungal sp. No.11243]
MRSSAAVSLLAALPTTWAWGQLGHATVAYMAQALVADETTTWAQKILADTSSDYMANIASWADTYRYTSAGKWSEPFHFVDAQDSPPSNCNVDYERDCTEAGCIISAMANYTRRVSEKSLAKLQKEYALRFIIHFVGDSHQPLHNEAYKLGGNEISVDYAGATVNFHAIWDTQIPEQINSDSSFSLSDAQSWANELIQEVQTGVYSSQASSWTSSVNVNDVIDTVTAWSSEANALVCSSVVPNGWDAVQSGDLSEDYYNSVVPTVELQIARAGVRLGAYLDQLSGAVAAPSKKESKMKRDLMSYSLDGRDFLPPSRPLTPAQKARRAADYACGCNDHKH